MMKNYSRKARCFLKSICVQLILCFVTISLVAIVIGSFMTYSNMVEIIERRNEQLVIEQLKQVDTSIQNIMSETQRFANFFQIQNEVQELLLLDNYSTTSENIDIIKSVHKRIDDMLNNYFFLHSILFIGNNNELIGRYRANSISVHGEDKLHTFYHTPMYENIAKNHVNSIWYGGYTQADFFDNTINCSVKNKYLITQVKKVKSISNPIKSAILVLNLDESYLSSIFSSSVKLSNGHMYIIDNDGTIILSNKYKDIGISTGLQTKIDKHRVYKSFTVHEDKSVKQLVYYKLSNTDWYAIREIPYGLGVEDISSLKKTFIIVILLVFSGISITSYFWVRGILKPLSELTNKMNDMSRGQLGLVVKNIPENELGVVIQQFNDMSISINNLIEKNKEFERQKRTLEIEALQGQINPHFLYNTLNMIKWMSIAIKAKGITECIETLGIILKMTYGNKETMCILSDELTYIRNYVKILNWRFGNRICFRLDVSDRLLEHRIPKFILQPIIENAITHGFDDTKMDTISITLDIEEDENDILIKIFNNGEHIPIYKLEQINSKLSEKIEVHSISSNGSIGLINVNRRIKIHFGDSYGLKIESSAAKGTSVILKIHKLFDIE